MKNVVQSVEVELETMQCGTCGVWHAIPKIMFDSCYREGGFWHCPNGHSRGYRKGQDERDEESLKKQLAREKKEKEWAIQEQENLKKQLAAQKGQNTKLKNRAKAGVCPCCNRTFKQLARHMERMHPEFNKEPALEFKS